MTDMVKRLREWQDFVEKNNLDSSPIASVFKEAADLIEKLPITKDGVRMVYGVDHVFCIVSSGEIVPTISLRLSNGIWWAYPQWTEDDGEGDPRRVTAAELEFWSSKEVAEAALEKARNEQVDAN